MNIEQYQIVIVNVDPTVGSEIKKTRPCVVISPDEMNRHLQTVTVAPSPANLKITPPALKSKYRSSGTGSF